MLVIVVVVVEVASSTMASTATVTASSLTVTVVVVELSVLESTLSLLVSVSLFLAQQSLFFGVVHDQVWQPEELDVASSYVNVVEFVELFALVVVNNHFRKRQVHPRVAIGQFAVYGLAVFQFDKNLLILHAREHE